MNQTQAASLIEALRQAASRNDRQSVAMLQAAIEKQGPAAIMPLRERLAQVKSPQEREALSDALDALE